MAGALQLSVNVSDVARLLNTIDVTNLIAGYGRDLGLYLVTVLEHVDKERLFGFDSWSSEKQASRVIEIAATILSAIILGRIPRNDAITLLRGVVDRNAKWPEGITATQLGTEFWSFRQDKMALNTLIQIVFVVLKNVKISPPMRN